MPGPPVMLASTIDGTPESVVDALQSTGFWWFELKFDGIRATLKRTARGGIIICNRRQADITHRYPDVVERMRDIDFVGVLDGEIVCFTDGKPDFSKAHRRDAQGLPGKIKALSVSCPAVFIPFDVLEVGTKDVRGESYTSRRMRLGTVFAGASDVWSVSTQDGATMWATVASLDLEGLIAKLGSSPYRPGRSAHWMKIKSTRRISALVSGVVPGKGSRAIGALELSLWDPESRSLVAIGRVGSGMSDADMRLITELLDAKLPVVVDVQYLEVSKSGQLRMPSFKGVRKDIPADECVIASLI